MSKQENKPIGGNTRYRFEQWVQNPDCEANVKSAVFDVRMSAVAEKELNTKLPGPSPFALSFGVTFEDSLFRNNAEKFRDELERRRLIESSDIEFLDFRTRQNRGPLADMAEARRRTTEFFIGLEKAKSNTFLLAGATISVPGKSMLPEAILILDALLAQRDEQGRWTIQAGEVKTYPDRGGFTDRTQLATARAQLGVYAYGLKVTIESMELIGSIVVTERGFLVLSKPGTNFPSIRPNEDLKFQIERAQRGFEKLRAIASESLPENKAEQAVQTAQTAYTESCYGFCPRAAVCYKRAMEAGDPIVLGRDVARFTSNLNLNRVVELISGKTKPVNSTETDFLERFQDAEGRLKLGGT